MFLYELNEPIVYFPIRKWRANSVCFTVLRNVIDVTKAWFKLGILEFFLKPNFAGLPTKLSNVIQNKKIVIFFFFTKIRRRKLHYLVQCIQ